MVQIHISNSPRFRVSSGAGLQACAIGLFRAGARRTPLHFFFPRMREGAERRVGASVTVWHLMEVPRAVVTRHARLPALHRGDFLRSHRTSFIGPDALDVPLSRQHWRCPSSDVVLATEGGPLNGAGR